MASFSADFWEKFWLIVVDKAALGLGFAVVGYFFQRQLEVFKRNQAFASEVAKLRIGAYYRVLAAVSAVDATGREFLVALGDHSLSAEMKVAASEKYQAAAKGLSNAIDTEAHLLNGTFASAALLFWTRIDTVVATMLDGGYAGLSDWEREREELAGLLFEVKQHLPKFARAPDDELFNSPHMNPRLSALAKKTMHAVASHVEKLGKGEAA